MSPFTRVLTKLIMSKPRDREYHLLGTTLAQAFAALTAAQGALADDGNRKHAIDHLWQAAERLTGPRLETTTLAEPSLPAQLNNPDLKNRERRRLFELALVIAQDARNDVLRLLHQISRDDLSDEDIMAQARKIALPLTAPIQRSTLETYDAALRRRNDS